MSTYPFFTAAEELAAAGWQPIPLRVGKKAPPPTGTTGADSPDLPREQLDEWLSTGRYTTIEKSTGEVRSHRIGNVGVRLYGDQCGIDVDDYEDKPGAATLAKLEEKLGPLPPTFVSTSRLGGQSGIRHYRIPEGVPMLGEAGPGIEIIQRKHRYAVVAPSVHPDTGEPYRWVSPCGEVIDHCPPVDQLADLPDAWVEYLRTDKVTTERLADAQRPIIDDDTSPAVDKVVGRFLRELGGGRHPAARTATCALERLREQEHPGVDSALADCRRHFVAAATTAGKGQRTEAAALREWDELVAGAVDEVRSQAARTPKYSDIRERRESSQTWEERKHLAPGAKEQAHEEPAADAADMFSKLIDGADWLLDGGQEPEPLWGDSDRMLAVRHQPTVIAGPQGAGKTTIANRLMLGAIGVAGFERMLGLPVHEIDGKALYLVADRPDQARLSLRRMVEPELVRGRLVVWPGPPPADVVKRTTLLIEMAERAQAQLVVLDSLKDVALKLSDDEVGSALNLAVQHVIAAGIDVVSLHHPRKLGGDDGGSKPRKLDDLYGSTWLTAGAGSVLYLHPASNGHVELEQFKTPNGKEASIGFRHDPESGALVTSAGTAGDVLDIVREAGHDGITVMYIVRCLLGAGHHDKQQLDASRQVVTRALRKLSEQGRVEKVPGATSAADGVRWREVVVL